MTSKRKLKFQKGAAMLCKLQKVKNKSKMKSKK